MATLKYYVVDGKGKKLSRHYSQDGAMTQYLTMIRRHPFAGIRLVHGGPASVSLLYRGKDKEMRDTVIRSINTLPNA